MRTRRFLHSWWVTAALVGLIVVLVVPSAAARRARKPKKAAQTIAPELEQQLWSILEPGTRTGDIPARAVAIDAITYLRPETSIPYAVDALKDPQWRVRAGAIRALIRLGRKGYEKALQDLLARSQAPVQHAVLPLFEQLPTSESVPLFLGVLAAPSVPNKDRMIRALVRRGGPFAKAVFESGIGSKGEPNPYLLEAVERLGVNGLDLFPIAVASPSASVHGAVVKAAAALPNDVPVDFLLPLLKRGNEDHRLAAAEVLAAHSNDAAATLLVGAASQPDPATQARALRALAGIPGPKARAAAKAALDGDTLTPEVADAALGVFAAAGDSSILPRVQGFLTDTVAELRAVAAGHLGLIQGPRALPTLYELLVDGYPGVRLGAARSLGALAQPEAIPHLQRALDDSDRNVRRAVAEALAGMRDKAVVGVVAFIVSDRDPDVRYQAARALVNAHHDSALPSLRIAVADLDEKTRLAAFRGLFELAREEAANTWRRFLSWVSPAQIVELARSMGSEFAPFLEKALASSREETRLAALSATKMLGRVARLTLLARLARESKHGDVRLAAMDELIRLQGQDAAPLFMELAGATDPDVQRAALAALGRVGNPDAVPTLEPYLVASDAGIRITAAGSLLAILKR